MTSKRVRACNVDGDSWIRSIERRRNWAIPSYDFGHLLDAETGVVIPGNVVPDPSIFSDEAIDAFSRQGDVALLFSRSTPSGVHRDLFVLRFGTEGYQRPRTEETWHWYFTSGPDGIWKYYDSAIDPRVPLGIWLLNNPTTIEREASQQDRKVNARLKLRNKPPLKATTVIRLTKPVYPASASVGMGSPKRAHDRRGYSYRRKDGRIVHVPGPIKVNGGASTPAAYRVVA